MYFFKRSQKNIVKNEIGENLPQFQIYRTIWTKLSLRPLTNLRAFQKIKFVYFYDYFFGQCRKVKVKFYASNRYFLFIRVSLFNLLTIFYVRVELDIVQFGDSCRALIKYVFSSSRRIVVCEIIARVTSAFRRKSAFVDEIYNIKCNSFQNNCISTEKCSYSNAIIATWEFS